MTTSPHGLTETQELQLSYWHALVRFLESERSSLPRGTPQPYHGMDFHFGRGCALCAIANYRRPEIRAQVLLPKQYFVRLKMQREDIGRVVGHRLEWTDNPVLCRVWLSRAAIIADRKDWPEQHAWLKEKLELLHRTFEPRVKALLP